MAQEHLAVANDSVLRRVPREAAATDPDRTARCSVVSLRWRVRRENSDGSRFGYDLAADQTAQFGAVCRC